MRWAWRREARRLFAFERETARRAVVSLFVSEAEAALFRERTGLSEDQVQVLENGIDLDFYRPAPHQPGAAPLIVFTGQMDYPPNVEGAAGFARDILPRVRARYPDMRFAIVGRRPDPLLRALDGRDGVEVTGEVADVRPWLTRRISWWRHSASRAASRTRCSRRWRWAARSSRARKPLRG